MEILIKLDERLYKYAKHHTLTSSEIDGICDAIANGNLLPKGHGRIGDLDRLYNVFEKNVVSADAFKELFDHAPTIIEADEV